MTARIESRVSLPMLPINRPTCTAQNCQLLQQWARNHAKIPGVQGCHVLAWGAPRCLLCSSKPLQMLWSTLMFRIDATGTERPIKVLNFDGKSQHTRPPGRKLGVFSVYYSFV